MGSAIEFRGLSHRYDTDYVLRDIDLTIEAGEIFGFLGHNGAGKTTAIDTLVEQGYCKIQQGSRGAHLISLVKPYRREAPPEDSSKNPF